MLGVECRVSGMGVAGFGSKVWSDQELGFTFFSAHAMPRKRLQNYVDCYNP